MLRLRSKLVAGSALTVFCLGLGFLVHRSRYASRDDEDFTSASTRAAQGVAARTAALEEREARVDRTAWAKEMMAEDCGRTFESLWDAINASTNKLRALAAFEPGELTLGQWDTSERVAKGINIWGSSGPGRTLSPEQWAGYVSEQMDRGWNLDQAEFRHNAFDTDASGRPDSSQFYFSAHLFNPGLRLRAVLEGDLIVRWADQRSADGMQAVKSLDTSHLTLRTRAGEAPFQPLLVAEIEPPVKSFPIDPVLLYDLDGDGLPEIILPIKNLVYHRQSDGSYRPEQLAAHPPGMIHSALIADFDGDGVADLICVKTEGLVLFKGSAGGKFDLPGQLVWAATTPLVDALALACGDIDEDGDLDVFIGQYRVPSLGQILRPHFYDANDGWPAYLLTNDGHGMFTDNTVKAGLDKKRTRRTYSASLVDLDGDGHLDLVVVSDFAGMDVYQNDGHGHFSDKTQQWLPENHAFGMSQTTADFNTDGCLDLLMIGMNSPTVDRLDHLGLARPDFTEDSTMRGRMTVGNRLFLACSEGGFKQTSFSTSIARSGWSWGCAAADFDNDGFPDVYIANGHESRQSVRDYEGEFWLHDIYVDDSVDDAAASDYFTKKFSRTRGQGWSYAGYEKNRLYLNQTGKTFLETGYLMGVALEQDCRVAFAADLDGDGRMDIGVTTLEVWPESKQTLRLYQNKIPDAGHWIGFRFVEEPGAPSPVGARILLRYAGAKSVRQIVAGDSYRSEQPATLHFGLGGTDHVESAQINWSCGQQLELIDPKVDSYHSIHAPAHH